MKKNVALALFIAFVLSFAAFFLYELFDTTITSERDISNDFEIPILGTVPNLDTVKSYGKKSQKSKYPSSFDAVSNNLKGEDK